MHYYQFHIADWALHTAHLSLEEEGVYRRLLDFYYDTEQPIPEKTQSVIRRLRLGSYEETVGLILSEFFVLQGDGWHNLRADDEITAYNKRGETARENGKKGGRPKKQKQTKQQVTETQNPDETQSVNLANPDETQLKANQEPVTSNQEPLKKGSRGFTPPSVEEVAAYCKERQNTINPQTFVDHYEANGWMRGKSKIKSWQACVRTWEDSAKSDKQGEPQRRRLQAL